MNVNDLASKYANSQEGGFVPPSTGLTSDALPKVHKPILVKGSNTRAFTHSTLSVRQFSFHSTSQTDALYWYTLRTTYGRKKKAHDFIISKGGTAFYPTLTTIKFIDSKCKAIEESRIPNILFVYDTEEKIKSFVYDNVNLPDADDTIISTEGVQKFQKGQAVRIVKEKFKGVHGVVTRYQGQQRVGIVIDGLLTMATTYIPNSFIEVIRK